VEQWLGVCLLLSNERLVICCGAEAMCASYAERLVSHYSAEDTHLATAPQHIPTQHDMLPQHLVCKYKLNCEYYNISLTRN